MYCIYKSWMHIFAKPSCFTLFHFNLILFCLYNILEMYWHMYTTCQVNNTKNNTITVQSKQTRPSGPHRLTLHTFNNCAEYESLIIHFKVRQNHDSGLLLCLHRLSLQKHSRWHQWFWNTSACSHVTEQRNNHKLTQPDPSNSHDAIWDNRWC